MADELTSGANASTPPEGQAPTSDQTAPQKQAPPPEPKVDLFKSKEFQGYQAQITRTVQALQQEIANLQQQNAAKTMEGMDDLEKTQFMLQQREKQLQEYEQSMRQQAIQVQRQSDLSELSRLTGTPVDVLDVATKYDDAVKIAIEYMKDHGATAQEVREAKREANSVDLGGGGAATPEDRAQRERTELLKKGDTRSLIMKILDEG